MNVGVNYSEMNIKLETMETENGLDDGSKTNGFLYVDINDYRENDLDGIEIKQEEEQVEDLTLDKPIIENDFEEIYFEESLPLNSLKNLVNHSPCNSKIEGVCIENRNTKRKGGFFDISVQKENISVKVEGLNGYKENFESKGYKLRTRTWSKNIDLESVQNVVERKKYKKLSFKKSVCACTRCGMIFPNKSKFLNHEAEVTDFECLNCQKYFCTGNLLNAHLKLCKFKKNRTRKFHCFSAIDLKFAKGKLKRTTCFKCDKCKQKFVKKQSLVAHILENQCNPEIYHCAICEETFTKKMTLKKHVIAHMKSQLQFQHCSQNFKNKAVINHTIDNLNSAPKCNVNDDLKIQINRDGNVNFITTECNKSFVPQECSDNQPCSTVFECHLCKKVYKGIMSYKKHLKSHQENGVKSETVNKVLINSSDFGSEMNQLGGFKSKTAKKKFKYECDTCGKGFLKLLKLKIHILNVHQGINYQCGKCSVKFPNQKDLDAHLNSQSCKAEELCKCKTCGKVFAKRDYLKKHQYMHMNVLFKCKYCYCAFMKEKSYKRHIEKMNCSKSARKIRMAEFNYKKCRICQVEYETEELLLQHFRVSHTDLEPHQCFCCDSCLPTFQDLQNHIHQHNIQKYTCNLCGKPYTSQEGFRKHRLKHKGAEFKCKFCDSEFLNESRFKFHEKTCKKNPESGYEPTREKEKPKKKDDKPKQSRQLHWESRIIMKRLRGDPKSLTGDHKNPDFHDSAVKSAFFDEPETDMSDERGWFNNYYKTDEDDIAFGLKKPEESTTPRDCDSDLDVSEFLQPLDKKKRTNSLQNPSNTHNSNVVGDHHEVDTTMDNYASSSSDFSSTDSEEVEETNLPIDYNPKKCRLCVISFSQEYELLHHFIKTHPGEYAHKCPHCEVQSPLYAQLKEHLKTHGIGIGIFNCDNCSKQFKSEKKMNNHNIRCKGVNNKSSVPATIPQSVDEECRKCGKLFHTKFGYRRHRQLCKKRKHRARTLEKSNASIKNTKESTVIDKDEDEGNDYPLSDAEAEAEEEEEELEMEPEKVTSQKSELQKLTDNQKFSSLKVTPEVAVNTTKTQVEEKKEEIKNSYTGEPPMDSFPCRLCDKKFQYERGIVMHFKSAHPGNKPLICHVCNMHLADKLKEHLKTHGIGEEFICELCGKRFNQKFLSKIHEMWHQGIEYKCNNCKQKFLNKEKMDKHIGENRCSNRQSLMRLPCDICGKSYRSKFGLSKHYITHTPKELRPVKNRMNCEYCGKWFEYNNGLQRHRRIHTGERPFCCRFCPKAFAQEGNCKAHERIHTGESKPRRKKLSAIPVTSSITPNIPAATSTSQLQPSAPPQLPPPSSSSSSSTVDSVSYPTQINVYIYNNIDPNGIIR